MLGILVSIALSTAPSAVTVKANQSLWVYTHASDPGGDQLLRIWGAGGMATPNGEGEGDDWSYGYLALDVSSLPAQTPTAATLDVFNINPPGYGDPLVAATTPLQARALVGEFDLKSWDYSKSVQIHPGLRQTVFGSAAPSSSVTSKDPIRLRIDLLKGPGDFRAYLAAARASKSHTLFIALTSAIDPNTGEDAGGKGGLYKVYSATAKPESLRPTLTVTYGDATAH